METLAQAVQRGTQNNFTVLRLVGAAMVLWGHAFGIVGADPTKDPFTRLMHGVTWSGEVGVGMFFVVSGFLVMRSIELGGSLVRFAQARILRIFPALLVANVLTVLAVWMCYSDAPLAEFFKNGSVRSFLLQNTLLYGEVQPNIDGAFTTHHHAFVNGSLWTLPAEVRLYAFLLVLACIGVLGTRIWARSEDETRWPTAAFVLFVLTVTVVRFEAIPIIGYNPRHAYPSQLFLMGMLFYVVRDHVRLTKQGFAAALVAIAISTRLPEYYGYTTLVLYPYVVFFVAYGLPYRARLNEAGDISYGLYLYAWPVQQMVLDLRPSMSPYTNIAISLLVTTLLAWASWKLVEQPAMSLKDWQVGERISARVSRLRRRTDGG